MASQSGSNIFVRALRFVWRLLDGVRRVLHLVVLLVIVALVIAALTPRPVEVPTNAALVLDPSGRLVDELSGDPIDRALAQARGRQLQETRLQDLLDSLELAADDARIDAVVLRLDKLAGGGLSKLRELAAGIDAFRDSGKRVIAYGDSYNQAQYYIAAHADEVYAHPYGLVYVEGFSRYLPYFAEALEKLKVDTNVFQVGRYKSLAEPFTRSDMSPEDREMTEAFLEGLWSDWKDGVAIARGLDAADLQRYVDEALERLERAEGDAPGVAVDSGLLDGLMQRDEFRARMRELVAAADNDDHGFRGIGFQSYLASHRAMPAPGTPSGDGRVAVIVASGDIVPGNQPPGTIGADSTAELIRRATRDEGVDALVFRVDSGGGSAFASELIRREIEVFQDSGRPVVVSMGSVAASGGYWISMTADRIMASPSTITGSIGVIGILPTFQRSLEQIGIATDGLGTTWLAGAIRPDRELGDDAARLAELLALRIYAQFLERVAESRGMSVDEVDAIAQGRVYTGRDALERGLVDELGELEEAIVSAAGLAGLEGDAYGVEYIEREPTLLQRMAAQFAEASGPAGVLARKWLGGQRLAEVDALLERVNAHLRPFNAFGDPRGLVLHCFCEVE